MNKFYQNKNKKQSLKKYTIHCWHQLSQHHLKENSEEYRLHPVLPRRSSSTVPPLNNDRGPLLRWITHHKLIRFIQSSSFIPVYFQRISLMDAKNFSARRRTRSALLFTLAISLISKRLSKDSLVKVRSCAAYLGERLTKLSLLRRLTVVGFLGRSFLLGWRITGMFLWFFPLIK